MRDHPGLHCRRWHAHNLGFCSFGACQARQSCSGHHRRRPRRSIRTHTILVTHTGSEVLTTHSLESPPPEPDG